MDGSLAAMRLLVLGGTHFLGRHLVDAALDGDHDVTIFHRGRHPAHRPEDVTELLGDRYGDTSSLETGEWDGVIDTSGYLPSNVESMVRLLSGRVGHCTFVSSISAYADQSRFGFDEATELLEPPGAEPEPGSDDAGRLYGELKVGCEQAAQAVFDGPVFVPRPGLIVGPHDPTDRFTYWIRRADEPGPVLLPDSSAFPHRRVIDARDLAAFILRGCVERLSGAVNNVDPEGCSFADLWASACAAAGSEPDATVVDEAFLLAHGVRPWDELPLWIPGDHAKVAMLSPGAERAREWGQQCRPLAETIADTLEWDRRRRADVPELAGKLTRDREGELLEAWAAAR